MTAEGKQEREGEEEKQFPPEVIELMKKLQGRQEKPDKYQWNIVEVQGVFNSGIYIEKIKPDGELVRYFAAPLITKGQGIEHP